MYEKVNRERAGEAAGERRAKTQDQALASLMRYASRAERSSGDALRLMRKWGIEEKEREKILRRLQEMNFIDDGRFAAAYVREKSELSGWGVHKIRNGLRNKGLNVQTIEQALEKLRDNGRENARLEELLERKLKTLKGGKIYEIKGKLMRFGLSRGYGYEAVAEAVEKTLAGIGPEDET